MVSRRGFLALSGAAVMVTAAAPALTYGLDMFKGELLPKQNRMFNALIDRYLFVSLHCGEPNHNDQSVNELHFRTYQRQRIGRSAEFWAVEQLDNGEPYVYNKNLLQFPICTDGFHSITHFGIGGYAAGCSPLLMYGRLDRPLLMAQGLEARFAPRGLLITI